MKNKLAELFETLAFWLTVPFWVAYWIWLHVMDREDDL